MSSTDSLGLIVIIIRFTNHNMRPEQSYNFKIDIDSSLASQKASVVLSYGIIYTQICNVANQFLALKTTIKRMLLQRYEHLD